MTEKKNGTIISYFKDYNQFYNYNCFIFNGKKEGKYKLFNEDGQLSEIYYFKNGIKEGEFKSYYENKKILRSFNFINDKIKGEYRKYHENGQLLEICNY